MDYTFISVLTFISILYLVLCYACQCRTVGTVCHQVSPNLNASEALFLYHRWKATSTFVCSNAHEVCIPRHIRNTLSSHSVGCWYCVIVLSAS
jgi:hypothetical protein